MELFIGLVVPFGIMMLLMYFMIVKPQKKQEKEHKNLLSELKNGDKVETYSGIIGRLTSISEEEVVISSEGTKLRLKKEAINRKLG